MVAAFPWLNRKVYGWHVYGFLMILLHKQKLWNDLTKIKWFSAQLELLFHVKFGIDSYRISKLHNSENFKGIIGLFKRSKMENNGEPAKQQEGQKQLPFNMLDRVVADRALAAALQEQASALMLETVGSDVEDVGDDDEEDDVESSSCNEDDENFESQYFNELEFFEEDEESDIDKAEEGGIDPDEMSYEGINSLWRNRGNRKSWIAR